MNKYKIIYKTVDGESGEVIVDAACRVSAFKVFEELGYGGIENIECYRIDADCEDVPVSDTVHTPSSDNRWVITADDNYNFKVNGKVHRFSSDISEDEQDDFNRKAIIALVNEMGYEPIFLFEELIDYLDNCLDSVPCHYPICAIGYDYNGCPAGIEKDFGDFNSLELAISYFDSIVSKIISNVKSFFDEMDEMGAEDIAYYKINLGKCTWDDDEDYYIQLIKEIDIHRPNVSTSYESY